MNWTRTLRDRALLAGVLTGVLAAATALVSGAAPAASTPAGALAYACALPTGTASVPLTLTARFPRAEAAGGTLHPAGVAVTIPAGALASLPPGSPVALSGTLTVTVTGRRSSSVLAWADLAAPAVTMPVAGPLRITPSGPLPPLRSAAPGVLTVAAGALTLTFRYPPGSPSPSPTPSPSLSPSGSTSPSPAPSLSPTTAPSVLTVTCAPEPGQDTTLATITVASAKHKRKTCPAQPKGGLKMNRRFPIPKPPHGSKILHPPPQVACAYIVGYSDVRKLNEAALIGPGLSSLTIAIREAYKSSHPNYFQEDSAGQLNYRACRTCTVVHGLPPAHATFLAFGFMPVEATMQLTEIGTMNVISLGTSYALHNNTIWSLMALRVYDVRVNGRPLPVGRSCRPIHPILTVLVGRAHSRPPYSLLGGGPLTGRIDIPRFTGCGVGENLDPILNATVAGPGNFVELTQGHTCFVLGGAGCPPKVRKPVH
jgi:hypothetical protein